LLKEWTNKRKVEFSNVAIPEHERIKPWREAYSKFGSKPSKYNSSIESLLKRATSGNDLPNINSVVDLYNAMSLKHLMPFGAEDLDKVKGDVQLTFAEGSEPGKYIGGKDIVTCDKGEVAYLDELGFICRRWNWRESDRTKLTDGTKNFILVIEALPPVKGSELEEAVVDFVSQAKENIGGEYSSSILTKDNPVFENGFKTGQKLTEEDIEKLKKIDDSIDRKKEILDKGAAEKGIKKEYVGIANNIYQAIKRVINVDEIHLETPEREEYGDYSSNVAMQLFSKSEIRSTKYETNSKSKISNSKQGTNKSIAAGHNSPRELAEKIAEQLRRDKELQKIVERIEVAGPGFINFHLTRSVLVKELENILSTGDKYGKTHTLKNKKIMVEFAHPNTHKAFHIGHLRNIALGESICRILEFSGYEIIRANYQGDVGMHIAKALWGIKKLSFKDPGGVKTRVEFLGKAYTAGATAYEDDEKAKEEIHKINKEIYSQEDEEINKLYNETRKWSLDYFESIYERVYTKFDRLYFESECYESGKKYTYEALEKGILKRSEGAIIFPGSEYGLHDRVFVTKEDVPTYEAKDFGLIKLQMKEY
ncbi:MAG: arginine--tRNA ligase, partial [Vallitaleaceae bacterium]|nr:arginine--tRNA ligase [Vallitaleaceae bacterium]